VKKNGRITEMLLVMKLFLKTNPFAAMGNWRMGLDLLKTGRLSLTTEKIERRGDIARMLAATDAEKGAGT
jgi:quinone-modifying oxidoreductase, subunit QmoC